MAKSIMTPEAADNLAAYRARKDGEQAERIDTRFFNIHPDRMFHVRKSLATEQTPTAADAKPITACLMKVDRTDRKVHRIFFPLDNFAGFPDEEAFLARMWVKLKYALMNGDDLDVSAKEHKSLLVETGNWKELA